MTVKNLIEQLKNLDQSLEVFAIYSSDNPFSESNQTSGLYVVNNRNDELKQCNGVYIMME